MFIFVAIILTSLKFSIAYEICAAATCATGKIFLSGENVSDY